VFQYYQDISVRKYKEMLMTTVKNALEILRYGSRERIESEIFGIAQKAKELGKLT
jgi:hypothetical protein